MSGSISIIGWNCRGLGSPSVIPDLKYLVHQNKIEAFRYVLGFDSCISVDRPGRSGVLLFFGGLL